MKTTNNVYQMVTDQIVKQMEQGLIPWQQPWKRVKGGMEFAGCISHTTGRPYSWLNQMLLGMRVGEWLTFNQCKAEGGCVKAGEKASTVVFWTFLEKTEKDDETGEEKTKKIPYLKYYHVFHIDQCTGIKPRFEKVEQISTDDETKLQPIEACEQVVKTYFDREDCTLTVRESNKAYYSPATDSVVVPMMKQYEVEGEYYSTLFHEITHSTGHSKRLNRDGVTKIAAFGGEDYSREELVAEMGSAFMLHRLGVECQEAFRNSVGYIQGWLKALKDDPKMIVFAAGKAEAAVEYIINGK